MPVTAQLRPELRCHGHPGPLHTWPRDPFGLCSGQEIMKICENCQNSPLFSIPRDGKPRGGPGVVENHEFPLIPDFPLLRNSSHFGIPSIYMNSRNAAFLEERSVPRGMQRSSRNAAFLEELSLIHI